VELGIHPRIGIYGIPTIYVYSLIGARRTTGVAPMPHIPQSDIRVAAVETKPSEIGIGTRVDGSGVVSIIEMMSWVKLPC